MIFYKELSIRVESNKRLKEQIDIVTKQAEDNYDEREKNRLFVSILLSFFLCNIINAQNLSMNIDTLSDVIVQIKLPPKYKKKKYVYDEGVFIDYYYSNGSLITLFQGAMQKTPLYTNETNCILQSIDTINGKISYQGFINDKLWHENRIDNLHVLYMNVSTVEKELFDHIMESVLILNK